VAKIDKSEQIDHSRRRFFGSAAVSAATAQLGLTRAAPAQTKSSSLPAIKPGTNTSFGPLKQVDAGVLNVGYAESGPGNGSPVILLHGWPYDIYSFVDVAPVLAQAGYRVIVPHHAISFRQHRSQRSALGGRRRHYRLDGCAHDRTADSGGLRLGRTHCQYYRSAMARALQGHGLRERLSDCNGGTNITSPPSAAAMATTNTGAISPSSSGSLLRRNGTSTMPLSSVAPRPLTIPTTSSSSSTITPGALALPTVNQKM
jgi:hypothetical protein